MEFIYNASMINQIWLQLKSAIKNPLFILLFVAFAMRLLLIIKLAGTDWEPDAYQHFLDLRTVFSDFPANLALGLSQWSKPLYSYPFGFLVNITGTNSISFIQVINAILGTITGWLIYKAILNLAMPKKIAITSMLIYLFGWIPFQMSVTAMTEPLYTFVLMQGFFFITKKKYLTASALIGLSVIARFEGFVILGVYALWLFWISPAKGKIKFLFKNWIVAFLPVAIWNFAGFLYTGKALYLIASSYATVSAGVYGFGNWIHFPANLLVKEPLLIALYSLGFLAFVLSLKKSKQVNPEAKILWLAHAIFIVFLIFQAILWVGGLFGSAGLLRYFTGVMPFVAIAGSQVWRFFSNSKLQNITMAVAVLVSIFLLSAKIFGFYRPNQLPPDQTAFQTAGLWIENNIDATAPLYATRPEITYFSGRKSNDSLSGFFENQELNSGSPKYLCWTYDWGFMNSGLKETDIRGAGTVVYDNTFRTTKQEEQVIIIKRP